MQRTIEPNDSDDEECENTNEIRVQESELKIEIQDKTVTEEILNEADMGDYEMRENLPLQRVDNIQTNFEIQQDRPNLSNIPLNGKLSNLNMK